MTSRDLVDPLQSVRSYIEADKATGTRKAYASDWNHFLGWCLKVGETPLPATPISVAKYISQLADGGLKVATIERRIAALRSVHVTAGFDPSPTEAAGVKSVMSGIRRRKGTRQTRKAPATVRVLSEALDRLSDSLIGLRDRALLLVGFAAALRRSELVALNVMDVTFYEKGAVLHIARSKTDQDGDGADVGIPNGRHLQPVASLKEWLAASNIKEGPIFREVDRHGNVGFKPLSDRSVARIIKKTFARVGVNVDDFSGHSLRAGFVTEALDRKVDTFTIMRTTRHVKVDTLRIYDRRKNDFDDSAGGEIL